MDHEWAGIGDDGIEYPVKLPGFRLPRVAGSARVATRVTVEDDPRGNGVRLHSVTGGDRIGYWVEPLNPDGSIDYVTAIEHVGNVTDGGAGPCIVDGSGTVIYGADGDLLAQAGFIVQDAAGVISNLAGPIASNRPPRLVRVVVVPGSGPRNCTWYFGVDGANWRSIATIVANPTHYGDAIRAFSVGLIRANRAS